ncbi:TonB-dependent receptor [Croceicoccus marinus]|uniref:TonB-dependent receptor n=1 Tax=Croceicoccus marinus TaxID=450378 RepID=A0A7G6VZC6_9SPHN|nr:TonB-dependent receptor [Croceicoccus marinus]QNE07091.1 TonB-dependent receptor [Croceicoccus marinus]
MGKRQANQLIPLNLISDQALSPPGAIGAGYTRVDLRLDWKRVAGSQFSAALFMRNAFDEEYIVGSNNQLPTQFASVSYLYGEPRTFGGEIRFDF